MVSVLLDQYQLLDRIGIGGMAEVWRATMRGAEGFERPVAIKRILPQFSGDEDFVAMFVDEAKIAVRLSHPNIVQIFDLGRAGDEWFIAMELVHGKDLRAVIDAEAARGQRVPLEVACHAIMKMCEGLQHAHFLEANPLQPVAGVRQIIHRDISPQNVLLSFDGEVKVTDFGLAKAAGRAAQTQAGTIKGKLAYMSPEQLRGIQLDHRSDVFAVGIVLWELLSGERLFLGPTDRDTIAKAFACKVPSLVGIDPTLDPELDRIAARALTLERDQRYASAEALHEDLEAFVYGAGLTLSGGSLAAYMRALFPQAEPVSGTGRKRDPRAVTAQIQLEDDAEELDDSLLESEPVPRMRSYAPNPSELPLSDVPEELSDHDIDALERSLHSILGVDEPSRSKSALSAPALPSIPPHIGPTRPPPSRASSPDINPTLFDPDAAYPELDAARAAFAAQMGAQLPAASPVISAARAEARSNEHPFEEQAWDDFDDSTVAFEPHAFEPRAPAARPPGNAFADEEQTPQFASSLAQDALHSSPMDSTHDDPDRTHMPSDDEAYALMAAENPPEDQLITRMVRPSATDLAASRELADASAVAPRQKKPADAGPDTARPPRRVYDGFDDGDDETTTGAGAPRRR
jgi:serine/threonine protein kinase